MRPCLKQGGMQLLTSNLDTCTTGCGHTQGNYLKRTAASTVLRLLYRCQYFIPISNLSLCITEVGTVRSIIKVAEQHGQQPEAAGLAQKPTLLGLFEAWAMVTAKCVAFTIQRGSESWVERIDATISSSL